MTNPLPSARRFISDFETSGKSQSQLRGMLKACDRQVHQARFIGWKALEQSWQEDARRIALELRPRASS